MANRFAPGFAEAQEKELRLKRPEYERSKTFTEGPEWVSLRLEVLERFRQIIRSGTIENSVLTLGMLLEAVRVLDRHEEIVSSYESASEVMELAANTR